MTPQSQVIATFYKFTEGLAVSEFAHQSLGEESRDPDFINPWDCRTLRADLLAFCQAQHLKGTILLAAEGINGTIAGDRTAIDAFLQYLRSYPALADLRHRESIAPGSPFQRLKVKIKREIVTMGIPEIQPTQEVGIYVEPSAWNDLISDPEVLVIDTRNDYEVSIGSFQGAINPHTDSFRDFPEYVQQHLDPQRHRKIAMFCTGGIRCEKASAYLLAQGFPEVYHLQGGILHYLEAIPSQESLWQGECFVFDERVALQQGLGPGHYHLCPDCGHPVENSADPDKIAIDPSQGCPHCSTETHDSDSL
jgi:UPF0176 protein